MEEVQLESPCAVAHKHGGSREKRDIWIILRLSAAALVLLIVVIFSIYAVPDSIMAVASGVQRLQRNRYRVTVILACLLTTMVFSAIPLPARAAWNLIVGLVYGWPGLALLVTGRCCGSLCAFCGVRQCFKRCPSIAAKIARGVDDLGECCMRRDVWNGLGLATLDAIEERPLRMVFLMMLAPMPESAISAFLGAKAHFISWRCFLLAVAGSSIKLIAPVGMGSSAEDVIVLASSGHWDDPLKFTFAVVSFLGCAVSAAFIGRQAITKLKDAKKVHGGLPKTAQAAQQDVP